MRALGPLLRRLLLVALLLVLGLLSPVAYVELFCRSTPLAADREPILPPKNRRPESNTLLTYPEWHIVHAYEDYAAVIRTGEPHNFQFLPAIGGFWSSLCTLTERSAEMGGPSDDYRVMVHVIGVSFTAELLLKAAYEETLGRVATWIRGPERANLDDLSASQAAAYAEFLQQVPWYRWDFDRDRVVLKAEQGGGFRNRERALALGLEYRAKALYARAIAGAVGATGADQLTMRSIVTGLSYGELGRLDEVTVIGERPEGVEIETPRYAAFTDLVLRIAEADGDFVEIAGNDDILLTTLTATPDSSDPSVLAVLPRQGHADYRELRLIRVADLSDVLRDDAITVEHIHDF